MTKYNSWETGISILKPPPETARKLSRLVYQSGKKRNMQSLFAEMVDTQHEVEFGNGGIEALRKEIEELRQIVKQPGENDKLSLQDIIRQRQLDDLQVRVDELDKAIKDYQPLLGKLKKLSK